MTLLPHKSTSTCVLSSVCRKTYGFSSSSLLFSGNIPRFVISNTLLSVWSRLVIKAILLEVTGVVSSFSKNNTVSPGIGTSSLGVSLRGSLLKTVSFWIIFSRFVLYRVVVATKRNCPSLYSWRYDHCDLFVFPKQCHQRLMVSDYFHMPTIYKFVRFAKTKCHR